MSASLKSVVRNIPLLGNGLVKIKREIVDARHLIAYYRSTDYSYTIFYNKGAGNYFSKLCDKHGTDKGGAVNQDQPYPWPSHSYSDLYSDLFDHCRHSVLKVFECGIGTNNPGLASSMGSRGVPGASLRVWRDYFPNAEIFGADIDRDILFSEERIKTFYIDQTDVGAVQEFWRNAGTSGFDIIIDDGLHTYEAGIALFEGSIQHLSETGVYIIEDVSFTNLEKFHRYFALSKYRVKYVSLKRPGLSIGNNNIVLVRI